MLLFEYSIIILHWKIPHVVINKGLPFTKIQVVCLKGKDSLEFNSSRVSDFFFLIFSTFVLRSNAYRLVCGIIFLNIYRFKKKKKKFASHLYRYCWVEHIRKVSGKKSSNFIWDLKKIIFLANSKQLSKIYAQFSIAHCTKKNKNDQVMGNSELN